MKDPSIKVHLPLASNSHEVTWQQQCGDHTGKPTRSAAVAAAGTSGEPPPPRTKMAMEDKQEEAHCVAPSSAAHPGNLRLRADGKRSLLRPLGFSFRSILGDLDLRLSKLSPRRSKLRRAIISSYGFLRIDLDPADWELRNRERAMESPGTSPRNSARAASLLGRGGGECGVFYSKQRPQSHTRSPCVKDPWDDRRRRTATKSYGRVGRVARMAPCDKRRACVAVTLGRMSSRRWPLLRRTCTCLREGHF
ncbi:hypothetical protein MRX96_006573 [Rhipicephalus microplus]